MGFDIVNCPNAYAHFANEIALPLHTNLTDQQVAYVTDNYVQILKNYI
jgi:dTDP-4-amino-4,6-dideoxygalactose transaminase